MNERYCFLRRSVWHQSIYFYVGIALLLVVGVVQAKPVELVFWHAMAGHLGDEVKQLVDDFNRSQNEYQINPIYKGNYLETLTSFTAAFRANRPPAIVQVFEVGTEMMLVPQGVIKPVSELMHEQGMMLPERDFIPSVRSFYSRGGRLMAMPFNLSVPILYYNADALARLGYSQTNFPKTWQQMEILAQRVQKAHYDCVYTTAYPGWVLFESYLAIHGLAITGGNPLQAVFNTPQLLFHFQRLTRWTQLHYLRYAGRVDDGTILFTSGHCLLFSQSSGAYNSLSTLVPFHLGVALMPLDTQASSLRHPNAVGGAALWAVSGQDKAHYRGIALFFQFLASLEVQSRWHQHTGYLPIGLTGVYASIVATSSHPNLLLARTDLEGSVSSAKNLGPEHQIRAINDESLEAMFAGLLSPELAIAQAVKRTNHALLRFSRNTQQ